MRAASESSGACSSGSPSSVRSSATNRKISRYTIRSSWPWKSGSGSVPRPQRIPQRRVLRMPDEPLPQDLERLLDALLEIAECARALLLGNLGPLLEPAGLGPIALARRKARGVRHEPQQHEVREHLAVEHRLEIELEVRLPRDRLAVAQDAKPQAVRQDRPQVRIAAVQEVLHQPVRVRDRRAAHAGRASIEAQAAADQVDRPWRRRTD